MSHAVNDMENFMFPFILILFSLLYFKYLRIKLLDAAQFIVALFPLSCGKIYGCSESSIDVHFFSVSTNFC